MADAKKAAEAEKEEPSVEELQRRLDAATKALNSALQVLNQVAAQGDEVRYRVRRIVEEHNEAVQQ